MKRWIVNSVIIMIKFNLIKRLLLAVMVANLACGFPLREEDSGSEPGWVPQYGTVEYPKSLHLSPDVRINDIYKHEGKLFRALSSGSFDVNTEDPSFPDSIFQDRHNWVEIPRGSFQNPKRPSEDPRALPDDIYINGYNNEFYRALQTIHIEGGKADFTDNKWQKMNEKAEWMTLLRGNLANVRLGDLIIPGSHDSGTFGITENHTLVDRNELFSIAPPEILANWSKTQDQDFKQQLEGGYRYFDLRIASLDNGDFRWWHGVTGDTVRPGLQQFLDFAVAHPQELILMDFNKFRSPGDSNSDTLPMPESRKAELIQIFRDTIMTRVVDRRLLTDNPTAGELWQTGKNLLVYCDDQYIRDRVPEFWPNVINHLWAGKSNPEELFVERCEKLNYYKNNFADKLSYIGAAITPNDKTIIGSILKLIGWDPTWRQIAAEVFPEVANLRAEEMSFEGLHMNLVDMADSGNRIGMDSRPLERYSTIASTHFKSIDKQIDYWLARKNLFKPNVIGVDKSESSRVVESAIRANSQPVPQEVAIAFQGNTRDGFMEWKLYNATGGRNGYVCKTGQFSYAFTQNLADKTIIPNKSRLIFKESQYPSDTEIALFASSPGSDWHEMDRYNIKTMIENNEDVYVRIVDLGSGSGFAYTSSIYNNFGSDCITPPEYNVESIVRWQGR